jgi:hypothetical protein
MKKFLLLAILIISIACLCSCDALLQNLGASDSGDGQNHEDPGPGKESDNSNAVENCRRDALALIESDWEYLYTSYYFMDLSDRAQKEAIDRKDAIISEVKAAETEEKIMKAVEDFGIFMNLICENPVSRIEIKEISNPTISVGESVEEWIKTNLYGKTLTVERLNTGTDHYRITKTNIAFVNGTTYDIGYLEIAVGVQSAEGEGAYSAITSLAVAVVPNMTGAKLIGTLSLPTNDITSRKELKAYDNEYGTLDGEYCRVIYTPDYIDVLTAKGDQLFITDKGNGVGAYYEPEEAPTFVYTYTHGNDNLIFEIYGTNEEGVSSYVTVVRNASNPESDPLITSYALFSPDMTRFAFHVMNGIEFLINGDGTLTKAIQ